MLASKTLFCVSGGFLFAIVAYYPPCYQNVCRKCFSVHCMWMQVAQLASCVPSPVEGCSAYGPWQGAWEQPQLWAWPSCTWQSCCPAMCSMQPLLLQHRYFPAVCIIPVLPSPSFPSPCTLFDPSSCVTFNLPWFQNSTKCVAIVIPCLSFVTSRAPFSGRGGGPPGEGITAPSVHLALLLCLTILMVCA